MPHHKGQIINNISNSISSVNDCSRLAANSCVCALLYTVPTVGFVTWQAAPYKDNWEEAEEPGSEHCHPPSFLLYSASFPTPHTVYRDLLLEPGSPPRLNLPPTQAWLFCHMAGAVADFLISLACFISGEAQPLPPCLGLQHSIYLSL